VTLITHNTPDIIKTVNRFAGNVRYAAARACNDLAKDVQQETINKILPDRFTLRAKGAPWFKPGNRFGFNAKFANKENIQSSVGSQADWLKLQEHGGTKQVAAHRLAIPSTDWKPIKDIMSRDKKPRAILEDIQKLEQQKATLEIDRRHSRLGMSLADRQHQHKIKGELSKVNKALRTARRAQKHADGLGGATGGKAFIATMRSGFTGIFKRLTPNSRPLKLLFSLTRYAKINPILGWEKAAQDLVNEKYDKRFQERLLEALK
jgi:hypothetical protein